MVAAPRKERTEPGLQAGFPFSFAVVFGFAFVLAARLCLKMAELFLPSIHPQGHPMCFKNDPRLQAVNMDIYEKSFVTGRFNEQRLKVAYYFRPDDGHLLASVSTGEFAAGPPGFVHGGAMAALLDEAMGVMAWFNQHPVVTANLHVDYDQPLPLGRDIVIDTWVEKAEERKVFTRGEIRVGDDVFARASALFIRLPMAAFPEPLGTRLKAHYQFDSE